MAAIANDDSFFEHWKFLLAAVVLHVVIGILFTVTINATKQTVIPGQLAIKAVVIDHTAQRLKREKDQAEAARVAKEQAEAEQKARDQAEAERQQREQQAQRVEEQRQQAVAEQKRKTEETRQATLRKKADDEKRRVAEIKNKQAEKQKTEHDAREQAQRENELKKLLADDEGQRLAENSGASADYYASIVARIENLWNKPPTARAGLECYITLTQGPGGTVLSVQIGKCNGDSAVRESLETAVYSSTPLPLPPDMRLFKRQLTFRFIPRD